MIFLLSLVLAALFIWGCAKPLKRHPVPFYIAATVIALAVLGCTIAGVTFPAWFQNWIWPIVSRSAFSTALFAAIMWTGALPNGSKAIKHLMPIRGELSILACILTLGHNVSYGLTYFRFLFTQPSILPGNQLAAAICSLVMICIMLPLFVTSFKSVRKKMKASSWKKLQRLAYVFYALIYVHVMLLTVPAALQGRSGYLLTMLAYSVVFLGYAACRIQKAVLVHGKRGNLVTVRRQCVALIVAVVVAAVGAVAVGQTGQRAVAARDEAVLAAQMDQPDESSKPEQEETAPSASPDVSAEPTATPEGTAPNTSPAPGQTSTETPASSAPSTTPNAAATPTPAPTPTSVYRDGTYSGTGQGMNGPITVSVTISGDRITSVSVVSSSDDSPYIDSAKSSVIPAILSAQSANVSAVSGATYSSEGIKQAVNSALASARN